MIEIVKLKEEDMEKYKMEIALIAHWHHEIYKEGNDEERSRKSWLIREPLLKRALENSNYGLLLALNEKNKVVGFLDYWVISCFVKEGNLCFLQNMRVHPKTLWGKGIGSALVKKLEEIARERNCIEIHVVAGNGANVFYQKLGFIKKNDVFCIKEVR